MSHPEHGRASSRTNRPAEPAPRAEAARPRSRRKPRIKRQGRRWRYLPSWKTTAGIFLLSLLGLGTFVVVGYARTPLPTEPQDGVNDQGSPVYYADGRTPVFRLGVNREVVRHDQVPAHVRWAVLAAEDRGFYSEPGVSPVGAVRALVNNVAGGEVQGGSTITQQLARNYYKGLSKDRSAGRKVKEIFIALKLDRHKGKDEILGLYLNTVFFGRQASGIQAASRAYFHKDVWSLTVAEAALLAAMIQQPAYFKTQGSDPAARALRQRWNYVIDGLVRMGKLSRAEADRQRFPATRREWSTADRSGQMVLVRQRVTEELRQLKIPMQSVLNGGLKIYTGLDQRWMEYAAQAVRAAKEPSWPVTVRAGLVAVDPRSGAVKAFYGGDPRRSLYDTVFNPAAQSASTFKPYVLAAVLRKGYSVKSVVHGRSPLKFGPDGALTPLTAPGMLVNNDEEIGSLGKVDLVKATALSVNTGYVKLGFEAGLDNVRRMAQDLGIPARYLARFKGQGGISLGTPTIPAVYQASAYAAFANGGTAVSPHLITKIVDRRGRPYPLPGRAKGRQVLTREQAAQATHAMKAVVTEGTGRRAALPDRETAGKTGTADRSHSAWYVGYVPQLSTAVMMFNTKAAPITGIPGLSAPVKGENLPAGIWKSFMEKVTEGMPPQQFAPPAFTGERGDWSDPSPPVSTTSAPGPTRKPGTNPRPGTPPSGVNRKQWCAHPANRDHPACQVRRAGQ